MSSYIKSLVAVGIALVAVICAAFWLRSQVVALDDLTKTRNDMKARVAGIQGEAALIAGFERRQAMLQREIEQVAGKFVGKDYVSPRLVKAVVKSASMSRMEMINVFKSERKADAPSIPIPADRGQTVDVISHEIILKGSYRGFVKYLQSMAAWDLATKIESMEITPSPAAAVRPGEPGAADAAPDEIDVTLRLSVFAFAQ